MTDILEDETVVDCRNQINGPKAAFANANDIQKEWLESCIALRCTADRLEEECIQERARLTMLENEFQRSSPERSEDKQGSEDSWGELVELRSEVRRLRQSEPEVSKLTVGKSESERIRARLHDVKERHQQGLIRLNTTVQDLEKSLEAVQHKYREHDGGEAANRGVVSTPRTAQDLEKSLEAVQHKFRERDGSEAANRGVVSTHSVGTLRAHSVGSPVGLVRPHSAGSLHDRRWRGPCGGEGGAFVSGRMVNCQWTPQFSERRSASRAGVKELLKNDGVLKILRVSLQSVEEDIQKSNIIEGSWPSAEHEAFMRIFRIFRKQSRSVICDRLVERFPSVPSHEIESHLDWCIDCEEKQSQKRELLSKFRDRMVHLGLEASEAEAASLEEKDRRGKKLTRRRSLLQSKQVEEWRRSREEAAAKAAALEENLRREKIKQEKAEKKREEGQREETRKLVERFQQKRSLEERRAIAQEQAADKSPVNADARKRIERRHAEFLKKLSEARQSTTQPDGTDRRSHRYDNVRSKLHTSTMRPTSASRRRLGSEYEVRIPQDTIKSYEAID